MREIYEDQQRKDMQEMAKFLEELKAGTNEELIFRLNERIAKLKGEIEEVSDKGIVEDGGIEAYSDNVRFETSRLAVRRPADKDKTAFLKVKEEYSYFKRTFSHEELKDALCAFCGVQRQPVRSPTAAVRRSAAAGMLRGSQRPLVRWPTAAERW